MFDGLPFWKSVADFYKKHINIRASATTKVTILGHTDSTGSATT